MATDILPNSRSAFPEDRRPRRGVEPAWRTILMPLASLKLTVVLFGLAIFLILAGTVAQIDKDIWQVISEYFRTGVAWIELRIFFPRNMNVPGKFPFPGGWAIGGLMAINLLAAHMLRFKVQARGLRMLGGVAIVVVGVLLTWLVVVSGANKEGIEGQPYVSWDTLWNFFLGGLALTAAMGAVGTTLLRPDQQVLRWALGLGTAALTIFVGWLFYQGEAVALGDSSMRILYQLIKATLASLVLLIGCHLLFKKRAGIVLLHAGIGLMMFSELLTGTIAVENQLHLNEGQSAGYVSDIRSVEIAVVDPSPEDVDNVVAIPENIVRAGEPIEHESLPFRLEVVKFIKNAAIRRFSGDASENLATAGTGKTFIAEEIPASTGTDQTSTVDQSAAYVKVVAPDGKSLGTYLLSIAAGYQDLPERVTVGDKAYNLFLRFKRTYKPYVFNLIDIQAVMYPGTTTPKHYESQLRLVDPSRNVDREVKIWMNNPLRYAGETFYQSNYSLDPQSGVESTGLQVVTNKGWMVPYVACMIVVAGMAFQFLLTLSRFLQRRAKEIAPADVYHAELSHDDRWSGRMLWIPLVVVLVFGGWMLSKARVPRPAEDAMNLVEFGKLPVMHEGRMKPMDTLARNSLRMIADRTDFVNEDGSEHGAMEWLLDVMQRPSVAADHRVFRIQNLELLDLLGLKRRAGFRYSLSEFSGKFPEIHKQGELVEATPAAERSLFQRKFVDFQRRLKVFEDLFTAFDTPRIRPGNELQDLQQVILRQRDDEVNRKLPLFVPPEQPDGRWRPYHAAWTEAFAKVNVLNQEANPATMQLNSLLVAYTRGDAKEFNKELAAYQNFLAEKNYPEVEQSKIDFEAWFNHFAPFYHAAVLYVIAFVLAAFAWLGWTGPLNRASLWLLIFTFVIHTGALVARIYISGRPPVTNLYSSAVFIGWACVLAGIGFEFLFGYGIGNVVAAIAGFATLVIAHLLSADGDTFTSLQAVLDTNFWLATHVVCITLGYSATYLAGLLGLVYILRGTLTPALTPTVRRDLTRMIYGTLCFATFLSFFGTVLGGLWADDSWGRFWGWDPKENGALIIVLWNAIVLHARWGGMVKERGMAVLAVAGNIAVSWSWFGVNELGTGLHSYGFTEGVALGLAGFIISQLLVIGLGSMPLRNWRSFSRSGEPLAV